MGIFSYMMERDNKRNVAQLEKIASKVEALSDVYKSKTDDELRQTTNILKDRLAKGETLDDILPDAFACVREASDRILHMRHFHVQILGGIALHQGRIAQMNTGEGKTLVATLPTYLNALSGKGVHVVTVNDYLAKVQGEQMSRIYTFLGLSVGILISNQDMKTKKAIYNCDIVYGTNNEFGFDYLRDNMVMDKSQKMQRGFNFAIVDEIDSILIDEARTPLIISGQGQKGGDRYLVADRFAKTLKKEDYILEERQSTIILSESGIEKAEKYYRIENLSDLENMEINHDISNALRANYIMQLDSNYMVQDDEIIIVDEFTGRAMPGRRYSNGLHQAIEAKEGLEVKDESRTLATITFQNFFKMYKKLSGMTGTAKSEEPEFTKIYNLDVVVIPTNNPNIRKDEHDVLYKTINGKISALVEMVEKIHTTGRPILIGTVTIEKSELISKELKQRKIKHSVLNAKNHELEAEIVAQAGRLNAVTIATNMAGRGTDILLGGNPDFMAIKQLKLEGYTPEQIYQATSFIEDKSEDLKFLEKRYYEYYNKYKETTDKEKQQVVALGGLQIIGSERHESRRIDDQLRGRAGRQGDPGSSVFLISMEDDLVRKFGGDLMFKVANTFKIGEDVPFQVKMLSNGVEKAQRRIEMTNFAIRKDVLQYDDVMNTQRKIIYNQRDEVLDGVNMEEQITTMMRKTIENICNAYIDYDKAYYQWPLDDINTVLEDKILPKGTSLLTLDFIKDLGPEETIQKVVDYVLAQYKKKRDETKEIGFDFGIIEKIILLRVVDSLWMEYIRDMEILNREIRIKAMGQKDPVSEYKRESGRRFNKMIENIWLKVTEYLMNTTAQVQRIEKKVVVPVNNIPVNSVKTANRNDPCPCGSGKKYKNCCGKGDNK